MTQHLLLHVIVFLGLGAFAGLLSGMLGVGGGVIIVPALAIVFRMDGFPPATIMQLAAGTSLAVMVVSMMRALLAHRHYHVEFWSIYKRWLIPIVIGVIAGVVVAHHVPSRALALIFGFFIFFIALKLLLPMKEKEHRTLPAMTGMSASGVLIGGFSAMLGIGGGALTVPFLVHCNVEMRRAVVVSTAVGITIAIMGTIMVIFTGLHQVNLPPRTIGYIYWPAWLGIAIGSLLFVPIGTALSHRLPVTILRRLLAVLLLVVGIHLVLRVLHA